MVITNSGKDQWWICHPRWREVRGRGHSYRDCLLINYNQNTRDKLTPRASDGTSLQGHGTTCIPCSHPKCVKCSWGTIRQVHVTGCCFPGDVRGKEPLCQCRRHKRREFNPWVRKIPWRRAWQPIPVFLPGEPAWTEEPGGLQSMGSQRIGHNWATNTFI